MIDTTEGIVHRAIAQHLSVDPGVIEPAHRLDEDLAILPLDLVLIALRLEESEKVELPIDRLDEVETVKELTLLVRRAMRRGRLADQTLEQHHENAPPCDEVKALTIVASADPAWSMAALSGETGR